MRDKGKTDGMDKTARERETVEYCGLRQRGEMRGDNVRLSGVCSVSSEVGGGGGGRGGTEGVAGQRTQRGWESMHILTMTTGNT